MRARRGDYGYDAPYALIALAALGLAAAVLTLVAWETGESHLARIGALYALFFFLNAFCFFYTTHHGKFRAWEGILDEIGVRGNERVLDMACGRGAVLTAVAARLTTGRATGLDLWSTHDQSGNARDVRLQNVAIEGVRDRVEVETGDRRALPFPDGATNLTRRTLGWRFWYGNPMASTSLVLASKRKRTERG